MRWRVRLLGPFGVWTAEGGPVQFAARSAEAVIALCALERGPAQRVKIAGAMWPDTEPASARTNLRTALHRVRRAAPGILHSTDGGLQVSDCEVDLLSAETMHRRFLLAPSDESAIECLQREWNLRKEELLQGWDDEWLESWRMASEFTGNEVGRELARRAEASDQSELALETWLEVLHRSPSDVEAIRQVLRLEMEIHGRASALERANAIESSLVDVSSAVRGLIASFRADGLEDVPKPDILRTRSEILLLARMFESNLRQNREEAIELIVAGCGHEVTRHPKAAFSLAQLALTSTSGTSPARVRLAMQAATLGSWVSEYDSGQHWARFALENLTPDVPQYTAMMGVSGFMLLEQRQFEDAEKTVRMGIEIARQRGFGRELRSLLVGLGGILLHTKRFEEAESVYVGALDETIRVQAENVMDFRSAVNYNLSVIRCMVGDWDVARIKGEECLAASDQIPLYRWLIRSPLGLARLRAGEKEGLQDLRAGLANTARERLPRYNQIALDFATVALATMGRRDEADRLAGANKIFRATIGHERSPAEADFLREHANLDPDRSPNASSRSLANEGMAAMNSWAYHELGGDGRLP